MVQIIDASVAVKWFVEEDGSGAALDILEQLIREPGHFAVPELFYFELAHVLFRLFPSPTSEQRKRCEWLMQLGWHRCAMTPPLYRQILRFQAMGLSGYDAAYVALAHALRGVWLTFDAQAHRRIAKLHLSELLQ